MASRVLATAVSNYGDGMISVDDFAAQARDWLAEQSATPPNWGAIMPPERRDQGMAWQARLHEAGYAGIHWPVEYGGRGLSIDHNRAWSEACTDAGVPAVLNMVGLVLASGLGRGPIFPSREVIPFLCERRRGLNRLQWFNKIQ